MAAKDLRETVPAHAVANWNLRNIMVFGTSGKSINDSRGLATS
jgi:hypothetical protein